MYVYMWVWGHLVLVRAFVRRVALCVVEDLRRITRHRGTSLIRNRRPLGPYSRTMLSALEGWAFSYERGTPVLLDALNRHHSTPKQAPLRRQHPLSTVIDRLTILKLTC